MKDTRFLYSIATLAIGSILAIFVGFATGTLPKSAHQDMRVAPATFATTPAKKDCDCCSKMTPEALATFRKRSEALQEQRVTYQKAAKLITQYGREEGLRRLRQSHPEIAEHLEHFTDKDTVVEKH